jgi:hypothetical protein
MSEDEVGSCRGKLHALIDGSLVLMRPSYSWLAMEARRRGGQFHLNARWISSMVGKLSSYRGDIYSDGPVQTIDLWHGAASLDAVEVASSSRSSTTGNICLR